MGEGQHQDMQVARSPEVSAARDMGGFWRTLPGILTAAGTFLAGLAGLAAVIVPNFFPKPSPPAAAERTAKPPADEPGQVMNSSAQQPAAIDPPPAAPAPVKTPDRSSQQSRGRYIAAFASDGFVVLRGQPTTASAEVRRVMVGEVVRCGRAQWTADGYRWRRCVDENGNAGYMSDTFLREE